VYKVLSAESCSGGDTAVSNSVSSQSKSPIKNPPLKNLTSSFSESFMSSGKQGGGAAVLGEGRDIVTRETCVPTSLNANTLGKAAVLHFA
jgi:hypothetical protein